MLEKLTDQLAQSGPLTPDQIAAAVAALVDERVEPDVKAGFLTALSRKGETVAEITAFARELRGMSVQPDLADSIRHREILDVCGTGGDRLNTFNISTTAAIICAAGGVAVAKHGNRAVTSQAGSADVLEALGIAIDLSPEQAARALELHGFAFFFAPRFHPAFRHLGPARKLCAARGQATIFNFLGPLLNPARPTAQLVGVPRPGLCEPLARALQSLGLRRGMVVSGKVPDASIPSATAPSAAGERGHLDELSTLGENTIAEFYQDRGFATGTLAPENFPLLPATLADLAGADRTANAGIVRRILHGEERGPKRDAVLLNAGAALFVAGRVKAIGDGWDLAIELIESKAAERKLKEIANFRP